MLFVVRRCPSPFPPASPLSSAYQRPSLGPSGYTVDDPVYRETVEGVLAQLKALRVEAEETIGGTTVVSSTRIVSKTTSHYDIGAPREVSPFVSTRRGQGDVTFVVVEMQGDEDEVLDNVDAVLEAVEEFEALRGFERIKKRLMPCRTG